MKKIKNRQDLLLEKQRLQAELSKAEDVLKDDLNWLNEEIKPLRAAGKFVKNIFYTKGGVVNEGMNLAISALLNKVVLSKAGWLSKLLVPFLVKGVTGTIVQENKIDFFNILRNIIKKARKTTTQNGSVYDKSSVEDVDY
jgi:hypothetical protein